MTKRQSGRRWDSKFEREEFEREEARKLQRMEFTFFTRREIESLWENSNKYPEWERQFIYHFENLRRNGIHSAKDMEKHFDKQKIRTLGGIRLDARLVNLLREKFRKEGKLDRPRDWQEKPIGSVESQIGENNSRYMYRPTPSPNEDPDSL